MNVAYLHGELAELMIEHDWSSFEALSKQCFALAVNELLRFIQALNFYELDCPDLDTKTNVSVTKTPRGFSRLFESG